MFTEEQWQNLASLNRKLSNLLLDRHRLADNKAWQKSVQLVIESIAAYHAT